MYHINKLYLESIDLYTSAQTCLDLTDVQQKVSGDVHACGPIAYTGPREGKEKHRRGHFMKISPGNITLKEIMGQALIAIVWCVLLGRKPEHAGLSTGGFCSTILWCVTEAEVTTQSSACTGRRPNWNRWSDAQRGWVSSWRAEEIFKILKIYRDCLLLFLKIKLDNFHILYIYIYHI